MRAVPCMRRLTRRLGRSWHRAACPRGRRAACAPASGADELRRNAAADAQRSVRCNSNRALRAHNRFGATAAVEDVFSRDPRKRDDRTTIARRCRTTRTGADPRKMRRRSPRRDRSHDAAVQGLSNESANESRIEGAGRIKRNRRFDDRTTGLRAGPEARLHEPSFGYYITIGRIF